MAIEVINLSTWLAKLGGMPKRIDAALMAQIRKEVTPLVGHMKSTAGSYGRMPAKAAGATHIVSMRDGLGVTTGSSVLLKGAEYGGRKRPKKTYVTQRRRGSRPTRPYIISRRTTQQFLPHLGNRGYWFWPTARKDMKGINKRVRAILREAMNSG